MLRVYLRKAPTLTVIGVTGFVAWPIFFGAGNSGPPKVSTKPSVTAPTSIPLQSAAMRNPFRVDRPSSSTAAVTPVAGSPESLKSEPAKGDLPAMTQEEDKVLSGMRLVGTFIDNREKLAVIDNKIYTQGDQLRGADGSLLPYVVTEILNDRALVRRGRRDFVIAFSNTLRTADPKAIAPPIPAPSPTVAKAETAVGTVAGAKVKGPGVKGQPPAVSADQKQQILQLLSGLGASAAGGSGTGVAGVNANSISAGLDALMGKHDNIGRENDT